MLTPEKGALTNCLQLAAGPTIALVDTALDFFPDAAEPDSNSDAYGDAVTAVAYYFTATSLLQGVSNFVWVPLANKYGRRPVYILSYSIYLACAVWLVFEESYNGFLAGRILMGVGSGAAETIGKPLHIFTLSASAPLPGNLLSGPRPLGLTLFQHPSASPISSFSMNEARSWPYTLPS